MFSVSIGTNNEQSVFDWTTLSRGKDLESRKRNASLEIFPDNIALVLSQMCGEGVHVAANIRMFVAGHKKYYSDFTLLLELVFDCLLGLLVQVLVHKGQLLDGLLLFLFLLLYPLELGGLVGDLGDTFGLGLLLSSGVSFFGVFGSAFELFVLLLVIGGNSGHC